MEPQITSEISSSKTRKRQFVQIPQVASLALDIPEFDIPSIEAAPDFSEVEKLKSLSAVIGLSFTVNPVEYHGAALKAVEVAHKYRDAIRALKKGYCNVRIAPTPGIVPMDWHSRLATDARLGRTIAVRGPAGNGKSLGVRTALEAMGHKVYHLDCTDSTTAEMLVGGLYPEAKDGGIDMVFRDGIFTRAFGDENGAIQLDEFDALDPRVAMVLQSALHRAASGKKRYVSCPDHPQGGVEAKGACPIVVTMNTWGNGATREYVGRNALDAASMDRFDTVIDTAYQNETEILKMTGLGAREAGSLVKKANETRAKIEAKNLRIVLSTRRLIDISESIRILGLSLEEAFSRDFTERLEPMDRDALGLALVSVIAASEPSTSAIASAVVRMSDEEFSAAFPNVIARCTEQSHYTTTHEDMANWHAGLDWQGCLDIAAKRYGYGIVRAYQVGDEI